MEISDIRIGQNIRALREAYGETEEELAAKLGFSGHQAIQNYELGKRKIDDTKKILFMNHFDVTVEELMFHDFSNCKKIELDAYINYEAFKILFPTFVTDAALRNSDFKEAYEAHNSFYNLCDKVPAILESLDDLSALTTVIPELYAINQSISFRNISQGYIKAYNDKDIAIVTSANCVAIYYLFKSFEKGVFSFVNDTALTNLVLSDFDEIDSLLDETAVTNLITSYLSDQSLGFSLEELQTNSTSIIKDRFSMLDDDEIQNTIKNMMITLKQSKDYSHLADYYDAFSIFMSDGIISQKGYKQMKKLSSYGNKYAERFLLVNPNPNE